jgi:parallel beta-helix repeat protein
LYDTPVCIFLEGTTTDVVVDDNLLIGCTSYGISLSTANINWIYNNVIHSSDIGIYLTASSENEFMNNTIRDNDYGFYLDADSDDNIIGYGKIYTNFVSDIYIGDAEDNVFGEVQLGDGTSWMESLSLSLEGYQIDVHETHSVPVTPTGYYDVDRYVTITNLSDLSSQFNMIMDYTNGSVPSGSLENTIRMWSYNGTSWLQQNSSLNIGLQLVSANDVTSHFGVFAPLGIYVAPPAPSYQTSDITDNVTAAFVNMSIMLGVLLLVLLVGLVIAAFNGQADFMGVVMAVVMIIVFVFVITIGTLIMTQFGKF